jgi:DNA-binding winged helix-turn-helix (wHTH) protein/TolB-like protein
VIEFVCVTMNSGPASVDCRISRFGAFEVDARASELRKQGVRIKIQSQPLKVLLVLLDHPGEVITREELHQRLWPDNTFVDFEHGLNSALTRLRQALADSADAPRYIETLPRCGYRFVAPVVTVVLDHHPDQAPGAASFSLALRKPWMRLRWTFLVVLGVTLAFGLWDRLQPPIGSLAVLPFVNAGGDPEMEYLADGIAENLTNSLSHLSDLRVTSRTAAFRYKAADPKKAGRELKVRAVLTGRVIEHGGRLNIQTELARVDDGSQLWVGSMTGNRAILSPFRKRL